MADEDVKDPLGWAEEGVIADLIKVCTGLAEKNLKSDAETVLSEGMLLLSERYVNDANAALDACSISDGINVGVVLDSCGILYGDNLRQKILEIRKGYLEGLQYDINMGGYEGKNDCFSIRSAVVLGLRDAVIYKLPLWMRKTVLADICVAYARGLVRDTTGKPPGRGWDLLCDMDSTQKTVYCVSKMYEEKIAELKRDIASDISLIQEMEIRFYSINRLLAEMVQESAANIRYLQGLTWAKGGIYYSQDREAVHRHTTERRIEERIMKKS